ncbi:MAG: hypothetical protein HFF50_01250 [Lawsonibacter sp.]|nr:hypothetical protein [Lawsonibacter sp.]
MKYDTVFKGGMILDVLNGVRKIADIAIRDGKIAGLGENLSDKMTWDITGKVVLPGVIDMHVHVTRDLGGQVGYYVAAASGVSTIVDYAGPMEDILEHVMPCGCGMNVGCLPSAPASVLGTAPSRSQVRSFLEESLQKGALGLKILGGHFPLTPDASRICVEECNRRKVFVARHAGSTETRSNIYGMREVVECSKGDRLLLAHVNAYCRGSCYNYMEELRDAFQLLRDNPNLISDSHMAVNNGTSGACSGDAVHDCITQNCLGTFGYSICTDGLEQAIQEGVAKVIAQVGPENILLERKEALKYWKWGTQNFHVIQGVPGDRSWRGSCGCRFGHSGYGYVFRHGAANLDERQSGRQRRNLDDYTGRRGDMPKRADSIQDSIPGDRMVL